MAGRSRAAAVSSSRAVMSCAQDGPERGGPPGSRTFQVRPRGGVAAEHRDTQERRWRKGSRALVR